MSCASEKHEGGCLCGAIRYRFDGPIESVAHCHCRSCRRSSGAVLMTWFTVPRDNFAWIRGRPSRFASSAGVQRAFCATCGTELTYTNETARDTIDVTVGSLDCAAAHPADRHIWTDDKLDWLRLDDSLPAHRGWSTQD
ncbi:MAG: GFA family protein [Rhodospirillales bacterium]|nr:MAG: GFA family protein [Rhodospirillales bacterium]